MLTWTKSCLSQLLALTIVCSALALSACPIAISAPAKPSPAAIVDGKNSVRIRQHSKPSGEEEIFVCPYGIKITNLRNRIVTLFPAPYKEVFSYNLKTKKIYRCSTKDYKSPYASSMALLKAITFTDVITSKYKEAPYKGCTAEYSKIPLEVIKQRITQRSKGDLVGRSPFLLEMVTTSKIVAAPEAARFLCIYYGMPQKKGLLLDMKYETFSRSKHQYLTTDKIEVMSFKPSDFAPPANYTRAKNDGDVLLDSDSDGSMNLMIMDH